MRDRILAEIRRLTDAAGGKAPGKLIFSRLTGISEAQWSGKIWARWSDAVEEAGCVRNTLQARYETNEVLQQLAAACRHYGHFPTVPELKLYRQSHRDFPSKGVFANHFGRKKDLLNELLRFAELNPAFADITTMIRTCTSARFSNTDSLTNGTEKAKTADGHVYMLKSGDHYKIGRSDELERRVKEVRIALPEALTLVHAIRTDDAPGIETYWHRRFADRRANGEWFKLTPSDVAAFKRRKFQ